MKRLISVLGFTLIAALAHPLAPAFAAGQYTLLGCQFSGSGNLLKWRDATTLSGYAAPAATAAGAWNSATTHITLTKVTTGANISVSDGNFGQYYNGLAIAGITFTNATDYSWSCGSNGYWTVTVHSWWNRYYAGSMGSNERQGVMVHEMGHALGLNHYAASTCPDIQMMTPSTSGRYSVCGYITPRQGDKDGVNIQY